MNTCDKTQAKWVSILLCTLALMLFLVACSNGQGTSNSAPAVTPIPTPKPTPTPTPTPTASTYTGTNFTMTYPQGWKETNQSAATVNEFLFQPSNTGTNGNTGLLVTVSNQTQSANSDTALNLALTGLKGQLSNTQSMTTIPSTMTIAGDTWKQGGLTGTEKGQQVKSIVLADYHAANQRLYLIIIADTDTAFDQDQATIFQPMLQSFKFV